MTLALAVTLRLVFFTDNKDTNLWSKISWLKTRIQPILFVGSQKTTKKRAKFRFMWHCAVTGDLLPNQFRHQGSFARNVKLFMPVTEPWCLIAEAFADQERNIFV